MGLVLASVWERTGRWHLAHRRVEVEAAAAGAAGKRKSVPFSLLMEVQGHACGQKTCGWADGEGSRRRRGGSRSLESGH